LIAVMVGQIAQLFMQKALAVDAVKTYREKFQFIPRQVLLEAARLSKPISEVFRPDLRFCVCVCVDWNDFKKIVNERAPTDVGLRVVEFYQDVSRSLERSLPAGNYFVDWIADELFIVIFARSQADDAGMCASALGLARDLCGVRQNFTRRNGYPDGITVGIAAGVSMVGVFGAEGIAKATAFGETPGIARRLQSVAKRDIDQSVRRDRVVMNERFTALIDAAEEQIEKIPVRHALKDLSVDHLRVLKTEKLTREG
jgi:class 3 adenylate cyclase